ncbi:MAG TPA: galactokinase family protein [Bryobacteraceae bacterium]|jgi:galactokinase|nr:galactokinase family protein [Bryobacteraceae bacterium]
MKTKVTVPGRVNLIGEHIDYHQLPVLPMAIQRRVSLSFETRTDRRIRAVSEHYGEREVCLACDTAPGLPGDWGNYIKAAVQAAGRCASLERGIDANVTSDLPAAAGLSSSSALLTAFTIALLAANGVQPTLKQLMDVLPDGEQFVGTRGGAMDHAAVLGAQNGCALLVRFAPLDLAAIPIPAGWSFLVAHSLTTAEKSGAVRAQYNARRAAGSEALRKLGFASFQAALCSPDCDRLAQSTSLTEEESRCFRHVMSEALRVQEAITALQSGDAVGFGNALTASHASLRDDLRVSCPALDELVQAALKARALGARLTGAGFGGCAIVFSKAEDRARIAEELVAKYYSRHSAFDPAHHLIYAEPSAGAIALAA